MYFLIFLICLRTLLSILLKFWVLSIIYIINICYLNATKFALVNIIKFIYSNQNWPRDIRKVSELKGWLIQGSTTKRTERYAMWLLVRSKYRIWPFILFASYLSKVVSAHVSVSWAETSYKASLQKDCMAKNCIPTYCTIVATFMVNKTYQAING